MIPLLNVYIYNKSHCDGLVHQCRALARQFLTLSSLGQGYHGHLFTVASMMGISKEVEFAPSGKLKKFLAGVTYLLVFSQIFKSCQSVCESDS